MAQIVWKPENWWRNSSLSACTGNYDASESSMEKVYALPDANPC